MLIVKTLMSGKAMIIKPRNIAKIPNRTFFPSSIMGMAQMGAKTSGYPIGVPIP
jgi:hypothetical protein